MVSQTALNTMKWWYEQNIKPLSYFEGLVTTGKITQDECNYILGVV